MWQRLQGAAVGGDTPGGRPPHLTRPPTMLEGAMVLLSCVNSPTVALFVPSRTMPADAMVTHWAAGGKGGARGRSGAWAASARRACKQRAPGSGEQPLAIAGCGVELLGEGGHEVDPEPEQARQDGERGWRRRACPLASRQGPSVFSPVHEVAVVEGRLQLRGRRRAQVSRQTRRTEPRRLRRRGGPAGHACDQLLARLTGR